MTDMNPKSGANANEIVDLLRKSLEKPSEESAADDSKNPKQVSGSADALLDQLRENMGETNTTPSTETFRNNDYDISGFEISEETQEDEGVAEQLSISLEETEAPPDSKAIEAGVSEVVSDAEDEPATEGVAMDEIHEDLPPWEENREPEITPVPQVEHFESGEVNIADHATEHMTAQPVSEIDASQTIDDTETEMDEVEAVSETEMSEEEVRKKVALFVEKTVEPDEEFDYFAELDKKAAKNKSKVASTPVSAEEPFTPIAVQETVEDASDSVANITPVETLEKEIVPPVISSVSDNKVSPPSLTDCSKNETDASEFFFDRKEKTEEVNHSQLAQTHLDDTDINVLLSLGTKEELEKDVGFVRVREAKNNFYDPADEDSIGRAFAFNGEEYRSPEQTDGIKTRYRKERKTLYRRLIMTALLSLLLLFTEHIALLGVNIPYVSEFFASDLRCWAINLSLVTLCVLISVKSIAKGAVGFFSMRPNQYTPVAALAIVDVIYGLVWPTFSQDAPLVTYHFALSCVLLLSILGDTIRLSKEILTFDVISDDKEKFSLEKAEASPEVNREAKVFDKRDLLIERVSFVGKYFARTSRRPLIYTQYFIELLVAHVVAIFGAVLTALIHKDIAQTVNAFVFTLFVCIPVHYLIHGILPFGSLSKFLHRDDSAIIGESVDDEYVGANTVYLDDIEVFDLHGVSVSGLRVYGDADFYKVLYRASAVFSRMEGPIRYVFENSSQEIEKPKSVKLLNIYANGIEALVDGCDEIFIGNINFMRSNGFFPKRNEDDDKKVENGEFCILYMTVNGDLCAKFYMKYTITQRFENFVSEMHANNTKVGIRTLDPNVTERMIALLRKGKVADISVIRPTLNDLVPLGRRSDSSIITAKNPHMIAKILAYCAQLKQIARFNTWIRVASMILGGCAAGALALTSMLNVVPALFIAIYQLIWLIPTAIYIKLKLNRK